MERCLTSLEMQIKTIMRYHHPLVRMTIIKMCTDSKCWNGEQYGGSLKK